MSGLPSVAASWIAALGRQKCQYHLSFQQLIAPSAAGEVHHRQQACLVDDVELPGRRELAGEPVVEHSRCELPEDRACRLIRGPGRAVQRAERLHLVEVLRVLLARERVGALRAELRGALDEERPRIPDRRVGVERSRRQRSPVAGIGADHEAEVERIEISVVPAGREHRRRRGLAGADAFHLAQAVRDSVERCLVRRVEPRHLGRRYELDEHVVGCRGNGRVCRCPRLHAEGLDVQEVRLMAAVDCVDGVVDRALDHRNPSCLPMSGRSERDRVVLCDHVPVVQHVGLRDAGAMRAAAVAAQTTNVRLM